MSLPSLQGCLRALREEASGQGPMPLPLLPALGLVSSLPRSQTPGTGLPASPTSNVTTYTPNPTPV